MNSTNINTTNTNTDDSWVDVPTLPAAVQLTTPLTTPTTNTSPSATNYLESAGIKSADAEIVINALGAVKLDDLLFVDREMATIAVAKLKLIPRKKALQALLNAASFISKTEKITSNPKTATKKDTTTETKSEKKQEEPTEPILQECIAICIDHSGSMACPFDEVKSFGLNSNKVLEKRSRMDAVKQIFYAYRDRTETLCNKKSSHQIV